MYSYLSIGGLAGLFIWRLAGRGGPRSVVRLLLAIGIAYVYWMYLPRLGNFGTLLDAATRQSQQVNAAQRQATSVNPAQLQVLPSSPAQPTSLPVNVAEREPQPVNSTQRSKLSATELEIVLQREPQFKPESQLRCKAATRGWDYTCSYMPAPLLAPTRVQFGVRVDETRSVERSRVVPPGTVMPRPQKRELANTGS